MTDECLCGCGCYDPPMPKDWMCSNCSEQKHLGNRDDDEFDDTDTCDEDD